MKTYKAHEDECSTAVLEALAKLGEFGDFIRYQRSLLAQIAHSFGAIELTAEHMVQGKDVKLASISDVLKSATATEQLEKGNGKG